MLEKKSYVLDRVCKHIKGAYVTYLSMGISLLFLTLILIIIGSVNYFLRFLISISLPFLFMVPSLFLLYILCPNYHNYKKVRLLLEENNEIELIKIAKMNNRSSSILALIALYDLQSSDFQSLFMAFQPTNFTQVYFNSLLKQIHEDKIEGQLFVNDDLQDFEWIPYTKVYYLDTIPENQQCMISKLPLDFYKDSILACPFCGNMAQKDSLLQWIEGHHICPICKRKLTASDCLVVDIKRT